MFSFLSPESVSLEITSLVDKFNQEREQLRFEKKQWEAQQLLVQQNKLKSVEDIVTLNIGGEVYTTSKHSLTNPLYSLTALKKMQQDSDKKKTKRKRKEVDLPLTEEEHFFSTLFSERFDVVKDKEGRIFIDRDGANFKYILNYLRVGGDINKTGFPFEDEHTIAEIKQEAEFYGLNTLLRLLRNEGNVEEAFEEEKDELEAIKELEKEAAGKNEDEESEPSKKKRRLKKEEDGEEKMEEDEDMDETAKEKEEDVEEEDDDDSPASETEEPKSKKKGKKKVKIHLPIPSIILGKKSKHGKKHCKTITEWIAQKTGNKKVAYKLLYRASDDGFTAAAFHSNVDNKGTTLGIMTAEGCIFGCFTSMSFTGRGGNLRDPTAFVFNVERPSGKKSSLTNEKYDAMLRREDDDDDDEEDGDECGIQDDMYSGPYFGDDLVAADNFNLPNYCSSTLGNSFNGRGTLALSNSFAVEEMEFFQVTTK